MGKLNNIDHSLLNDILNNKLAGYSEDELKTPEERAEERDRQKLELDEKKISASDSTSTKPKPVKKPKSKVPGGVWKISASDEKELDYYEGFPIKYEKDFFTLSGDKVMFYIIKRQYSFKPPQRWYVDIINQGYKDCNIDREYLIKKLKHYNIDL